MAETFAYSKPFVAILRTGAVTKEELLKDDDFADCTEEEIAHTLKVYEMMNGECAVVVSSAFVPGQFDFICLADKDKDRDLHYFMEQHPLFGCYKNDRAGFEAVYNSGHYATEAQFVLPAEMVEKIKDGGIVQ